MVLDDDSVDDNNDVVEVTNTQVMLIDLLFILMQGVLSCMLVLGVLYCMVIVNDDSDLGVLVHFHTDLEAIRAQL